MPERRKKSSGASRPIIANTTSFGRLSAAPSPSSSSTALAVTRESFEPSSRRTEPGLVARMRTVIDALTRSDEGFSICTSAAGSCSSARSFSTFSGLGRANSLLAIAESDLGAGERERDRRLHRRVAAAHDEHLLPGVVERVVEPMVDLVEVLARAAELAIVAASADADDHPQRAG